MWLAASAAGFHEASALQLLIGLPINKSLSCVVKSKVVVRLSSSPPPPPLPGLPRWLNVSNTLPKRWRTGGGAERCVRDGK